MRDSIHPGRQVSLISGKKPPGYKPDGLDFWLGKAGSASVAFAVPDLARLAQELALDGLDLATADCGGFLEILPLLPLADNALFFHHALEALDGLLEGLVLVYDNLADTESPPFNRGAYCTDIGDFVNPDQGFGVASHAADT